MAYKDNKLYVYTYDHYINFLDFSGDFPKETLEGNHYLNHPFPFVVTIYKMRIAIANSGEVMIFLSLNELNRKFCICELNLQVGRVGSLGDQLLISGHGVTIRGPVKDRGIKSDSVCLLMMIICLIIICGEERSKVWINLPAMKSLLLEFLVKLASKEKSQDPCVSSLNITNEYLNHKCFLNQGIYNSGSEYEDSLNILFRKVRTDDYARTGFMHLTKGPASDSVTVMFQCRGDSYGSKCRTCADTAVAGINTQFLDIQKSQT
ncbi:hypothetical protein YC2023_064879 [Brassica napus]